MNSNFVLKKGNIEIRPVKWEDTANIIKWRNSTDIRRNFIWQGTLTEEIHDQWLHRGGLFSA